MDPVDKAFTDHLDEQRREALARSLSERMGEAEAEKVPAGLVQKTKRRLRSLRRVECPHCGKAVTPFRTPLARQRALNALWALAALASFTGSFLVPRYFLQFLVLTALFGIKWIVDQRATKTQILIYKALQEKEAAPAGSNRIASLKEK